MRKLLTFRTESGDRLRVLWSNGECKTQAALEKVLAGGVSWEGIRTSGDTSPRPKLKMIPRKLDADNPEFLGLQNPPKAVKPVETDEEGKPKAKRVKTALTAEEVTKLKTLAESMTVKQATEETGIPTHKLVKVAKENGFAFVKGKRGGKRKAPPVDASVLESVKAEAAKNITIKEASAALGIPYPKLYKLAKDNGITFKAGKKGRQKKAA